MQFYVGDFLSTTMHLTLDERGVVIVLQCCIWQAGGKIPNNPAQLARMCGISESRWHKISPEPLKLFECDGEFITQKRLTDEYQKQIEIVEKRREAGTKGAAAKSLKSGNQHSANANSNASAKPKHPESYPELEPEPKSKKKKNDSNSASLPGLLPAIVEGGASAGFNAVVERYPKKDSAAAAEKIYNAIIKKKTATEAQILAGVDRMQRVWAGTDDLTYCPRLVNWLRDQRWNDQHVQGPKHGVDSRADGAHRAVATMQDWANT